MKHIDNPRSDTAMPQYDGNDPDAAHNIKFDASFHRHFNGKVSDTRGKTFD